MRMSDKEPQPGQAPLPAEASSAVPAIPDWLKAPKPQDSWDSDTPVPDWLKGLAPEEISLPPAKPIVAAAKAETVAVKEDELPDWFRPAVPLAPAGEQVIDGTAVAAPNLEEAPVAPGGDGGEPPESPSVPGDGGKQAEWKREQTISPEKEAEGLKVVRETVGAAEKGGREAAEARPPVSVIKAVREGGKIAAAELEVLKKTALEGVLTEEQKAKRLAGKAVQEKAVEDFRQSLKTYHRPHLESLRATSSLRADIAQEKLADVEAAKSRARAEKTKTARQLKKMAPQFVNDRMAADLMSPARKEATLRSIAEEEAGLTKAAVEAEKVVTEKELAANEARLAMETAQAEFVECDSTVRHIERQMQEAQATIDRLTGEFGDSEQAVAERAQLTERLQAHIKKNMELEQADQIAGDIEDAARVFEAISGQPLPIGSIEADLLEAVKGNMQGQKIDFDRYLVPLMNEVDANQIPAGMKIGEFLKQRLSKRAEEMHRMLALTMAETPGDKLQRLFGFTGIGELPESFRRAAEAAMQGKGYLVEVPEGGAPALRDMALLQGKVYADVLKALGFKTESYLSGQEEAELMRKAGSGELRQQFAADVEEVVQGNLLREVELTKRLEEEKVNQAAEAARAAETARLAQEKHRAEMEEQRQQAVWDQAHARFEGKESGLREAEIEAAKASLAAEFAVEFGAGLPVGMEAPREGQSAEEWRNEVRGQLMENAKSGLADLTEKLRIAREGTDAEAQLTAARELAVGMVNAHRVPEMREEVERIYNEALDVMPEGEDKKHDKGVADRMKEFADLLGGKMDVNKLVERLANTGVGPLRRERTDEEKDEIEEQVMGAEIRQMENIRAGGGLTKENAEGYTKRMEELNAALEGAGILSAGAGSLLNAGFELAIQSMFGGK